MKVFGDIAERYRDFAEFAAGDSPCFAEWSRHLADDPEVHAWLSDLPEPKQQPNLVFAAARWHGAPAPAPYDALRRVLLEQEAEVKQTIVARATQTNEVGRLTAITPALAQVMGPGEPVTLVELGASAGLCLFPDRWDYDWDGAGDLRGSGGPLLTCRAAERVPVPPAHPRVVQRIGLDLHPLDVYDADQMAWLENLVWPEQEQRRARLRAAIEVVRADPPDLRRGDLRDALPALVEEAGRWGTPVVFHSAVLAYVEPADREQVVGTLADLVAAGACHWISNEAPHVVPGLVVPEDPPAGRFSLAVDRRAVAWSHGHGATLDWFA